MYSFYTAGRIARQEGPSKIYDLSAQAAVQRQVHGPNVPSFELLPFNHPPLLMPIHAAISIEDYWKSYVLWSIFLILMHGAAALVIWRALKCSGWNDNARKQFAVACLTFFPSFISVVKGQDTAVVLLGSAILLYGITAQRDYLAGFGISLTLMRPQLALVLIIPFIFKRRKVLAGFMLAAGALAIYCLLMIGPSGVNDYISLLETTAKDGFETIKQADMYNILGMLLRIFPNVDVKYIQIVAWCIYATVVCGMACVWWRVPSIGSNHVGLAFVLTCLAAPHLHYHDLSLLIVPVIACFNAGNRHATVESGYPALILLAISICLAFGLLAYFRYGMAYALMLLLFARNGLDVYRGMSGQRGLKSDSRGMR